VYRRVDYPYETRWQLDEGEHTIRAGFVNARILSDPISIRVAPY